MPDFSKRSDKKELLDAPGIPFADISRNMQELEVINKYLGGHRISINGLKLLLKKQRAQWTICEIGCGGGDNLKAIKKYCNSKNINVRFIGIDINPECIAHAKQHSADLPATWIVSDYRSVQFPEKPDIIFSSLFCHHFTDAALTDQIRWMQEHAGTGFFINDLHRSPLAYYAIKLLTNWFSRSYLVRNDAPLSVLRGFKRKELVVLMQQSPALMTQIKWQWAFRWLVVAEVPGSGYEV
jgi:2-polyprenyl-3-methyl-5-hydroxy-6-metoxy-1,4-benzoquinol methylase